jgi:ribosomal-protein-alanine N-acetyltransferase
MQKYRIRRAAIGDISLVFNVEAISFTDPWPKSMLTHEAHSRNSVFLVAELDGDKPIVIGYAITMLLYDEAHLSNIAVHPDWRKMGVGSSLLSKMLDLLGQAGYSKVTLEVRESNLAAISMYEKLDFVAVGKRPRYYLDNSEDAVIMWRKDK